MDQPIIHVQDVTARYETQTVLENVDFKVNEGDFIGLVGPNGSGKSTLLKIILGLIEPSKGKVQLFGTSIKQFKQWSNIGYVSQKANTFNRGFPATVEEIVGTGLYGKIGLFKRMRSRDKQKVMDALRYVGLENLANRNITKLSGGQQQRVFIARGIVNDPKVLILDEPTVGVDQESVQHFYQLLNRLNKELGMTLILVSHDIGIVTEKVTKLACLNKQLVFHGTPNEFEAQRGIIENTYGENMHLVTHNH